MAKAAQRGDAAARAALFKKNAALVKFIAHRFHGPDPDDLFQAACLGWMHALRTWRPNGGANFQTWMTFWARAYSGRMTKVWLKRGRIEREPVVRDENGAWVEVDVSDDGDGADGLFDGLVARQAQGIVDGMKDRRLAIVLQERMRGHTLDEVARRNTKALGLVPGGQGRESVRKLELRAVAKARALVRVSA